MVLIDGKSSSVHHGSLLEKGKVEGVPGLK
jgi:hypothetical protein